MTAEHVVHKLCALLARRGSTLTLQLASVPFAVTGVYHARWSTLLPNASPVRTGLTWTQRPSPARAVHRAPRRVPAPLPSSTVCQGTKSPQTRFTALLVQPTVSPVPFPTLFAHHAPRGTT